MSVMDFRDYRKFIKNELRKMPKLGRGQSMKLANLLGVHTTMITHIMGGKANLTVEQALSVAKYLGLNDSDSDYFVHLVLFERSTKTEARDFFRSKLQEIKERSLDQRQPKDRKKNLSEGDQAIFYSAWYLSAIRLLTSIEDFQTPQAIAKALKLPMAEVHRVLQFLVSVSLCEEKQGKFKVLIEHTFLPRKDSLVFRHHQNWRMRALEEVQSLDEENLSYTNPVVISKSDFLKIRALTENYIKEFQKISVPSPSEELCCLTIDWVRITKNSQES